MKVFIITTLCIGCLDLTAQADTFTSISAPTPAVISGIVGSHRHIKKEKGACADTQSTSTASAVPGRTGK